MPDVNYWTYIEILGTISFAISAASHGMKKRLDYFGVLVIAFVTSIGGGTVRDLLIGSLPVAWMRDGVLVTTILVSTIVTIFIRGLQKRFTITLFIFDSIGLGLFTLVGVQKGIAFGFSPGMCIALGTITGCFGGIIRDVLLNNVPLIFRKEIYASAAILGALTFFGFTYIGISRSMSQILSVAIIVAIRIVAVKYHLRLPAVIELHEKRIPRKRKMESPPEAGETAPKPDLENPD